MPKQDEEEELDVAARRTRRSPTMKKKQQAAQDSIQGTPLEPVRYVTRELTRPDGSTLSVKVPVYPPFELAQKKGEGHRRSSAEKKAS